jgi:hypothetical protein
MAEGCRRGSNFPIRNDRASLALIDSDQCNELIVACILTTIASSKD